MKPLTSIHRAGLIQEGCGFGRGASGPGLLLRALAIGSVLGACTRPIEPHAELPPSNLPVELEQLDTRPEFSVEGGPGTVVITDQAVTGVCHSHENHGAHLDGQRITYWRAHTGSRSGPCILVAEFRPYRATISGLASGTYVVRVRYLGSVSSDTHPDGVPDRQVVVKRGGSMDSPEQLVHDWWRAWAEKDLGSLLAIAREDYVEFTGHSEQHRDGRTVLADVAEQAFAAVTIRSWQVEDVLVRELGGDAVVVAYRWSSEVEMEGGRHRRFGVATDVVSRRDDRWQYVAHHSSLLGTVEQPGSREEAP